MLCHNIAGNKKLKRAFGIYLYMQAVSDGSGVINFGTNAKTLASKLLFCTPRTIEMWICEAMRAKLIQKTQKTHYKITSINKIRSDYNLLHTGFYFVPVGKISIKDIFLIKFIYEQKQICHAACRYKLKNDIINSEIQEVVREKGIEYSDTGLKNCQIFDFSVGKLFFNEQQRFIMSLINTDYETGCKRYADLLGYNSASAFSYQKRRLKTLNAINYTARKIIMPDDRLKKYLTTKDSRETMLGHVQYFRRENTLNLFLCDRIDVFSYNNWGKC